MSWRIGPMVALIAAATMACEADPNEPGEDPAAGTAESSAVETVTQTAESPTPPTAATEPTPRSPTPVESCSDLLAENWTPSSPPEDFAWDPESGIAEVHIDGTSLTFDLYNDKDCLDLPEIGHTLRELLEDVN